MLPVWALDRSRTRRSRWRWYDEGNQSTTTISHVCCV